MYTEANAVVCQRQQVPLGCHGSHLFSLWCPLFDFKSIYSAVKTFFIFKILFYQKNINHYLMISHFNSMAVVQLSKHSHKCCFDVCQYQKCVENVWGKSNSISHKSNRKHFDTPSMNNIKPMRTTDSWNWLINAV